MEKNNNDLKEKYVVTSRPSGAKSAIGGALFALAIVFMVVAAIVCFMLLKDSQAIAIAMIVVSFLLGLCLIGISTIIKEQSANSRIKYYVEEYVATSNVSNSVSQPNLPGNNVSKEVVREELMTLISAVIKEELKNVKYTAEAPKAEPVKVEAPKAEPVKVEAPKAEPVKVEAPKVEPVKVEAPKVEPVKVEAPKAEPVKVEAPKAEPVKVETPKAEPVKVETPKVEPVKVETPKAEPVKVEAPKAESHKMNEDRTVVLSKKEEPAPAQATPIAPVTPMAPTTPVTPVAPEVPKKQEEKHSASVSSGEWRCNNCGRINRTYIGMCACGTHISENDSIGKKVEAALAQTKKEDPKQGNYSAGTLASGVDKRVLGTVSDSIKWSCKLCGRLNENTVSTCECGNSKSENDALTKATASTEVLHRTGVNVIKSDSPFLKQEERPKNVKDPNSVDYDVAAARAAEEKKLAEEAAKAAKVPRTFTQISADEWRCNLCNRVNRNYIGTCACGNSKG